MTTRLKGRHADVHETDRIQMIAGCDTNVDQEHLDQHFQVRNLQ